MTNSLKAGNKRLCVDVPEGWTTKIKKHNAANPKSQIVAAVIMREALRDVIEEIDKE